MYDKPITFDKFVRWMGYGLLILAIIILVNYLGSVLLPFAAAWLLAYLLYPMVKFVQYKLHVPGRVLSIVVTLIVVIAILTGIAWLIIPPMIEQFERLSELVTAYIQTTAKISASGHRSIAGIWKPICEVRTSPKASKTPYPRCSAW